MIQKTDRRNVVVIFDKDTNKKRMARSKFQKRDIQE